VGTGLNDQRLSHGLGQDFSGTRITLGPRCLTSN